MLLAIGVVLAVSGIADLTSDEIYYATNVGVTCRVSSDHSLLENGPVRVG